MLIDKLYEMNYDFDSLPEQVKRSIDVLTELRINSKGQANQKLEVLDSEIFKTIVLIDVDSDIVQHVRSLRDFDEKLDSNNSFNSTGYITVNKTQDNAIADLDITMARGGQVSGGSSQEIEEIMRSLDEIKENSEELSDSTKESISKTIDRLKSLNKIG